MMTEMGPISQGRSLVDRAKAILLNPKAEWPRIDAEPMTVPGILTGYVLILAAIPPVCGLIGGQIFGYGALGVTWKPSLTGAIGMAVTQYLLSVIALFVLGIIINLLANQFGGTRDKVAAFKVAAYSSTASYLGGIFSLVPSLGILGILAGLYSLYLLHVGLPLLMKAPAARAMGYTVVTILCAVVLFIVAGTIAGTVSGALTGGFTPDAGTVSGEMTIPGVGKIDVDKMEAASKQMEAAAKKMENAAKTGASAAVAPDVLQALLPEKIGRFARIEIESSGMAAGAHARATYEAGSDRFEVQVSDLAMVGALSGLGAALQVNSNKETATGYEKTQTIDGRIVTEEWDRDSREGKFGTTVANRFMVEAEGTVGSIDELKAAVAAVGPEKLAGLAKE